MSLPVIIRPAAEVDIEEIREYLGERGEPPTGRFTPELREVLERIEEMPE